VLTETLAEVIGKAVVVAVPVAVYGLMLIFFKEMDLLMQMVETAFLIIVARDPAIRGLVVEEQVEELPYSIMITAAGREYLLIARLQKRQKLLMAETVRR